MIVKITFQIIYDQDLKNYNYVFSKKIVLINNTDLTHQVITKIEHYTF